MQIKCNRCGKGVSSQVPEGTIVRAWVECPECVEKDNEPGIVEGAMELLRDTFEGHDELHIIGDDRGEYCRFCMAEAADTPEYREYSRLLQELWAPYWGIHDRFDYAIPPTPQGPMPAEPEHYQWIPEHREGCPLAKYRELINEPHPSSGP